MTDKQIKLAHQLGFAGLLPFFFCLPANYFLNDPFRSFALDCFIAYSVVILTFTGAVHWGVALKAEENHNLGKVLAVSVLPSLLGWISLLLPQLFALIILTFAFPSVFIHERFSELSKLFPNWFMRLRIQLTMIVTLPHFLMLGVAFR